MGINYIVKIKVGYCEALFSFKSIENAASFMQSAYMHKKESEDFVDVTMEIKEEN